MKPYQIQGLIFVGICLVIGLILAIASNMNFMDRRPSAETGTANTFNMASVNDAPYIQAQSTPAELPYQEQGYATEPVPEEIDPPTQSSAVASLEVRERASRLVYDFYAATSGSTEEALAFVARSFAPSVRHYGVIRTRQELLREHDQYMARWPERTYRIQPQSLSVSCDETGSTCRVSGLVTFDCANPERGAVSRGVSSFSLQLSMGPEAVLITSDDGAVVRRM